MVKKIVFTLAAFSLAFTGAVFADVTVMSFKGEVSLFFPGREEPEPCDVGLSLSPGTKIITSEGASVDIAFERRSKNIVTVEEGSEVIMVLDEDDRVKLIRGEVFAVLTDLARGETFRIKTPLASCGARGTAWRTKTDGESSEIAVADGKVFVRGIDKDGVVRDKTHWVNKGFQSTIRRGEYPVRTEKMPAEKFENIRRTFLDMAGSVSGRRDARRGQKLSDGTPRALSGAADRGSIKDKPLVKRESEPLRGSAHPYDVRRRGTLDKRDFRRKDDIRKKLEDKDKDEPSASISGPSIIGLPE